MKNLFLVSLMFLFGIASATTNEDASWQIDLNGRALYLNSSQKINYLNKTFLIALQNDPLTNRLRILLSVNDVNDITHRVISRLSLESETDIRRVL